MRILLIRLTQISSHTNDTTLDLIYSVDVIVKCSICYLLFPFLDSSYVDANLWRNFGAPASSDNMHVTHYSEAPCLSCEESYDW